MLAARSPVARLNHRTSPKPQFTASYCVSQISSVRRARARSAGMRGSSAVSGHLSSRYSRITVDSNSVTSPSCSTGTSARGLAEANGPSGGRPSGVVAPNPGGSAAVKASPFSRSAILTFWA